MRNIQLLLVVAFLAFALACGGGGGGSDDEEGVAGASAGAVSGFGSFIVTGTAWSLSATGTVEIDDATGDGGGAFDESDLKLGMHLEVEGTRKTNGTGTATSVRTDDAVVGAIDMAPAAMGDDQKTFDILDRTVVVDQRVTVFVGTDFASLAMADVLKVSGPLTSAGQIRATRVELLGTFPAEDEAELKGTITAGGGVLAGTFDIDGITVSYDCNTGMDDCSALGGPFPSNGDSVEVEGVATGASAVDAAVLRPFVPFATGLSDTANLVLEGTIESFVSLGNFMVNGVMVDASDTEVTFDPPQPFAPPAPSHSYADGDLVRVTGDLASNVLTARSVSLGAGDSIVAAQIPSGGLDDRGSGLLYMLTEGSGESLERVVVVVPSSTRIEDASATMDPDLDFSELIVSDYLEVRGVEDGSGRLRAASIVRRDAGDVIVQGRVDEVDQDNDGGIGYTTLGVFVQMDGTTTVAGGTPAFLAALMPGDLVHATEDDEVDRMDLADTVVAK